MQLESITRNGDFVRAYKRGRAFVHPHVVLYVSKNRVGRPRVGLTASKKVGGAVARNRARRVLRAALCQALPPQLKGVDLVLVARAATPQQKSTQVAKALAKLFAKAGLAQGPAGSREKNAPKNSPKNGAKNQAKSERPGLPGLPTPPGGGQP